VSTILSVHRVVLARTVARRWLEAQARPEYRVKVFFNGERDGRGVGKLLHLYRDGKTKVGGVEPILDLGIREEFDHLVLWSEDQEAMVRLSEWFEKKGYETTGVW